MSNFCLYRFIAQKVCAFPIKTLCVSYKNTVCFIQKHSTFCIETQYVLYENTVRFYRKGCPFLYALKFSVLSYQFNL
jgi:hypothetical protein